MSQELTKFYEFRMERERSEKRFTLEEAARATGYEVSSLKTNISKHLKGRWVELVDG